MRRRRRLRIDQFHSQANHLVLNDGELYIPFPSNSQASLTPARQGSNLRARSLIGALALLTCIVATYLFLVGPRFVNPVAQWQLGGSHKNYENEAQDAWNPSPSAQPDPPSEVVPANVTEGGTKRVLLVSALFPLAKSKHSPKDYERWLQRFLGQVTTDVYFYAPRSMEKLVLQTVSSGHPLLQNPSTPPVPPALSPRSSQSQFFKLNTAYETPFSTPPLQGLEEVYRGLLRKDRQKKRHSPELYAVWNSKPFFLNHAVKEMQERGQVYDYAFWVDAGSFREEHAFNEWPDPGRVDEVFEQSGKGEDAILFPIFDPPRSRFRKWKEDQGPVDDEVSEGAFSIFLHIVYLA